MSLEELLKTLQKEGILPQDTALQFIEVPQDPLKAIFRILQEMPDGTDKEMAILWTAFSEKFLHSDFINGLDDFLSTVHPLTQSRSPLIRHVALDILCRRELHLGNTPQADIYRRETPPLRPSEFPPGCLGCYIKYEETASKAILDWGYWDSDHPDHQLLERLLERLKASVADQRVDIEELRNAMAMANTKGRRLLFLGRLSEDAKLLEQAWNEFVYFQEYWGEIFEYTAKENLYNETPQRQRNQCVECLTDYWFLTRKVLPCPDLPLEDPVEKANSYDLVAELSQSVTHEVPISLASFFEKADSDYKNWKGSPCFLPYEKMLIYGIGSESEQEHARQQLKQAFHLKDPSVRSGILALLGMRSAFVLDDLDWMNQIYHEIARDNPLKKIADTLMENPAKITFRCPY